MSMDSVTFTKEVFLVFQKEDADFFFQYRQTDFKQGVFCAIWNMIIPGANYSVPWQKRRSKYCQEMEVRWIRRRRLCSDFTLCFHFSSVLSFVFFLLLVAFGCCLIVTEHWVPNLHFSSLKFNNM